MALGRMQRGPAVALTVTFGCIALGGVVGLVAELLGRQEYLVVWGVVALAFLLAAGHYVSAIRWSDFHKAWPRRRSSRHRAPL